MKDKFLNILVLLLLALPLHAQLAIDGRHVCLDTLTQTLLATVPEECFSQDVTLAVTLEEGWQQVIIDDNTVTDTYTFRDIDSQHSYDVTLRHNDGSTLSTTLYFTFLPIVRLQGTFGYDYTEGSLLLIDPLGQDANTLNADIKWRGGTTNGADKHKRNYKVKLKKNNSLLGMRNDDSWILDAGQADVFRLRNRVAWDIWSDIAHTPYYIDKEPAARNTVSGKVVELFLNDEYRGIYNFSENLDRKQLRLKQVQDGEVRGCLYKAKGYGYSNMNDTMMMYDNHSVMWENIECKYPDLQDNDTTDWSTLYNAFNFVVFSTDEEFEQHVADYFDLSVLADFCIFAATLSALDNRGKNTFWAVYDKKKDKKLTPVPWDLDCTTGQEWAVGINAPDVLIDLSIGVTNRLNEHNVLHFNDTLNNRYKELRKTLLSTDHLINRYVSYYNMITNSGAATREENRWSGDSDIRGERICFKEEIAYITNWLTLHMDLFDKAFFPLYKWYESIESVDEVKNNPTATPNIIYTIGGQRVDDTQHLKPGIYIRYGKKIIVK